MPPSFNTLVEENIMISSAHSSTMDEVGCKNYGFYGLPHHSTEEDSADICCGGSAFENNLKVMPKFKFGSGYYS